MGAQSTQCGEGIQSDTAISRDVSVGTAPSDLLRLAVWLADGGGRKQTGSVWK